MEDLLGSYNNGQGDFLCGKNGNTILIECLLLALIGILLPLFVTIICQRMRLEEVIYGTYDAITETAEREGGEELEEQLPFILAKEIRADAEDAALMAQCVIARTTLYDAAARGEEQPAAFSEEELRQALGKHMKRPWNGLRRAWRRRVGRCSPGTVAMRMLHIMRSVQEVREI